MKIINSLENLNIDEKTSVALGNFDGVHVGHQKIMENALEAADGDMQTLCFTFSNHPFNFIMDRDVTDPAAVKLICSEEDKIELIEGMGFDILVNVPFDETIMKMRAHEFFKSILIDKLNAGHISVGFNYTYGARAEGKTDMLIEQCAEAGIGIYVQDAVKVDGKIVSSTLIREVIKEGNMELAYRYLGRPLVYSGIVEHGRKLGSANGIPTANIPVHDSRMAPPSGVYFTRAIVAGKEYASVSNIGFKPTVQESGGRSIETNLFDFGDELYGNKIKVLFDHFSRPEVKFGSKDELFEQIRKDCQNAKEYYKK